MYQRYKDRGFIIISMYAETYSGSTPTPADLTEWADQYGLTHPVVADPGAQTFYDIWGGGYTPANALIAPGGQLVTTEWVEDADIEAVLPM
jgi:hypothetical protein